MPKPKRPSIHSSIATSPICSNSKWNITNTLKNMWKFEQLRLKLLNGEPVNVSEVTGDAMAKMLKEIEETETLGNPYYLPEAEML
jgi:hypothetical protein